jgi:hypothetical protein
MEDLRGQFCKSSCPRLLDADLHSSFGVSVSFLLAPGSYPLQQDCRLSCTITNGSRVTVYLGSLLSNNWETDRELQHEAGKCRCRLNQGIDTKKHSRRPEELDWV